MHGALAAVRRFVAAMRGLSETEVLMARQNYHLVRREKERVRKARQQEKLQRRTGSDPPSAANVPQIEGRAPLAESGGHRSDLKPQSGT